MRYLFVLFLIGLCLTNSLSQILQPARWEEEIKFTQELYSIVSLHDEGIALIRDSDKYQNNKRVWELIILDTALQKQWSTELNLSNDLRFTGYEHVPGKLNLMFRRNHSDLLHAEIFMVDLATQQIKTSIADVKLQIRLTHYTVVEDNYVFGGYVGREPVLIIHDASKENDIIVPGFFLTETELMDVRPNKNNTFNIVLFQRTQGQKKIIFRTFDKIGNILIEDEIPINEETSILNATTSILEHDEVLVSGAYAYKNGKQAVGVFSCLIDPFADQTIRYTEFHQLEHFLDYLPERKARKIHEKAKRDRNKGKPPDYHANVDVHRIQEFEGGFALFGEVFIASTASNTNLYSSPYYSPAARNYSGNPYSPFASRYYNNPYINGPSSQIEEMRMLSAFVIAYDFSGKRVWDYAIRMGELKVPGHDQFSDFTVDHNTPYILFKEDNDLKYANPKMDTTEYGLVISTPIKLSNEFERIKDKDEIEGNIRHWYGHNFFIWGVQSIKDMKARDFESSRRAFFINKIQVE